MTIDNSLCQQSVRKNSSWAQVNWMDHQVNWMDHQFSGSSPSLSSPKYLGRKKKVKRISNISNISSIFTAYHHHHHQGNGSSSGRAGVTRRNRPRELLSTLSNKWCSALETALPRTARHWPYVIGLWPYCHAANFSYDI